MKKIIKSPWVTNFDAGGCNGCILEIFALLTPRYDIERFGCLLKASARHADILLVSGIVNTDKGKTKKNL